MVKMVAALRRRTGMTPEEFRTYWREKHGPLIQRLPAFTRHIRRYVQMHPVDLPMPADATGMPPYDGFAEMWFDSFEEMGAAFAETSYLEHVRPDEQRFLILRAAVCWWWRIGSCTSADAHLTKTPLERSAWWGSPAS